MRRRVQMLKGFAEPCANKGDIFFCYCLKLSSTFTNQGGTNKNEMLSCGMACYSQ